MGHPDNVNRFGCLLRGNPLEEGDDLFQCRFLLLIFTRGLDDVNLSIFLL